MKQLFLLAVITLCCSGSYAKVACNELGHIADNNYVELDALELQKFNGTKGQKNYFHSAPARSCKLNKVFIIPNDIVTAYYSFENEGETWLFVVYKSKSGKKTSGWVEKKNFTFLGTTALDN